MKHHAHEQIFLSALVEKTREKPQEAADLFNRILQLDPANDASLYELANIKRQQKDYAGALELLEKAVAAKPKNEWYWIALAENYQQTNNIPKLESTFNELIKINPDRVAYYYELGDVYFVGKKYDEALKLYDNIKLKIYDNTTIK